MIEIVVYPVGRKRSDGTIAGRGSFRAMVGERVLVISSRTPFLSAARVLLAEGVNPETRIWMRHAHSSVVSLRSTVGEAATLTVDETGAPRFQTYAVPDLEGPRKGEGVVKDGDSTASGTDGPW